MSTAVAGGLLIENSTWDTLVSRYINILRTQWTSRDRSLIAIGIGQDVPFVATHHLCRIGIIILFAPLAFRLISQYFLQKKKILAISHNVAASSRQQTQHDFQYHTRLSFDPGY